MSEESAPHLEKKPTYVFMDESGDPGFKLERGSSALFCLVAVIFRSPEAMDETEAAIHAVKQRLHLPKTHEFHFNQESDPFRTAFCEGVGGCAFTVRAIVIDKTRIYEDSHLRRSPEYFYNFFTRMLLQHSFGSIENAKVYIDGSMNRELRTYLRQQLNTEAKRVIQETSFRDSRTSPLIQLADMMAGSISRAHRPDDKQTQAYVKLLRPRLENVWEFGEEKED